MNLNRSVFLLFLRQTWWKLLLVLWGMAEVEYLLFRALYGPTSRSSDVQGGLSLQTYIPRVETPLTILCCVGVILFALLLTRTWQPSSHNRPDYTLDRLSVSPRRVWLLQGSYHALCFLLFWGVQALVFLFLTRDFGQLSGNLGPQDVYLATWRSPLFHFFLPMEDVRQWLATGCLLLAMAFGGARAPEEGKTPILVTCAALMVLAVVLPAGSGLNLRLVTLCLPALALYLANVWHRKEGSYESEETFSE